MMQSNSKEFNIPRQTLNTGIKCPYGGITYLTREEESKIAEWIEKGNKSRYPHKKRGYYPNCLLRAYASFSVSIC